MPIYEYRCKECGHVFSRLQRVGAPGDGIPCPECGSASSERLLSTFASASSSGSHGTSTCGRSGGGFT